MVFGRWEETEETGTNPYRRWEKNAQTAELRIASGTLEL